MEIRDNHHVSRAAGRDWSEVPRRAPSRWSSFPLGALQSLAAALLVALLAACEGRPPKSPISSTARASRVILITIDTLRADHLGCYGFLHGATPALDALAARSVVYQDATSAAPITLVSHATILTGLTPPSHGVRTNGSFRLPLEVETLPERLKAAGFATAAFVGSYVLNHEFGLDQGFELYDDRLPKNAKGRKFDFDQRRAGEVLSAAGDWALARAGRPFFLWAHLFDPHAPYEPPPPFDDRFAGAPYDGEIAYVDAELAKFFTRLRDGGALEGTLVIVTADHGEGLGDHGEKTHGLLLYQSTLRVPLMVSLPASASAPASAPGGAPLGARVLEPVGLVDLAPTILAAVGAPPDPGMEGRILPGLPWSPSDVLARTRSGGTREAAETRGYSIENLLPFYSFGWAPLRGYRAGTLKIIEGAGKEIYDLAADPGEAHDLARERATDTERLAARMDEETVRAEKRVRASAENPDLSSEARERLLALGYAGVSEPSRRPRWGEGPDPRSMLDVFDGIDQAKKLLGAGSSAEGIAVLENLVAKGAKSVTVLGLLGQERMERGEIDRALAVLIEARRVAPLDQEIHRRLAEAYYTKGEYRAALAEADEAVRLNERNAESQSIRGAALARLGRLEEAIRSFKVAIGNRPNEPGLYFNLGTALESGGKAQEAEEAYAKAVALGPGEAPPRVALGRLLLSRNDLAGARAQFEAASQADPANADAAEQLGIALARAGDSLGALRAFDRAVELAPQSAEAHFDRGLVLERLGRKEDAIRAFREFLLRWKGDPSKALAARSHLARLGT